MWLLKDREAFNDLSHELLKTKRCYMLNKSTHTRPPVNIRNIAAARSTEGVSRERNGEWMGVGTNQDPPWKFFPVMDVPALLMAQQLVHKKPIKRTFYLKCSNLPIALGVQGCLVFPIWIFKRHHSPSCCPSDLWVQLHTSGPL